MEFSAGGSTSVVVTGVSGAGKTTVAKLLARRLGWPFSEGDGFHPAANVAKMRSGHPLEDTDREPWLRALDDWIGQQELAGRSVVLTCSALKRRYRDALRDGNRSVWFAHVTADPELLRSRVEQRNGHYMPSSLLGSQLAALEPLQDDEPGVTVCGAGAPDQVVDEVLAALVADRGMLDASP